MDTTRCLCHHSHPGKPCPVPEPEEFDAAAAEFDEEFEAAAAPIKSDVGAFSSHLGYLVGRVNNATSALKKHNQFARSRNPQYKPKHRNEFDNTRRKFQLMNHKIQELNDTKESVIRKIQSDPTKQWEREGRWSKQIGAYLSKIMVAEQKLNAEIADVSTNDPHKNNIDNMFKTFTQERTQLADFLKTPLSELMEKYKVEEAEQYAGAPINWSLLLGK